MADNPTVLVLDDDQGVRDSLALLLRVYGYDALTACTLDEARELLRTAAVQAVILDVGLPQGGTGLDLLSTIRGRTEFQKVPVLILTGGILTDAEEVLITRHRAFLFHKPEGFDTLLNFLDSLTGRDRSH